MTVSALFFFASTLLNFALPANCLVYRTNDAIIIEDSNLYQPMNPFLMVRGTEFMDNLYGAIPVHPLTGLMYGPPSVYPWLIHNNKPPATAGNVKPTDSKQKADTCGAGPTKMLSFAEQSVVGGVEAEKNSWPSIVVLKFKLEIYFCEGSLIAPDQVLTAAHCVDWLTEPDLRHVSVHLGIHKLKPSDAQETRTVRRVTIHGGWNPRTHANNIAIITLSLPVKFTSAISPVCLPTEGTPSSYIGYGGTVGWGLSKERGPKSDFMQQTTIRLTTNAKCIPSYGNLYESMICAAAPGKETCQSDSGGPLLAQFSSESGLSWTQIGIANFGDGCANPDNLGIYTRVISFRSWIREHANV